MFADLVSLLLKVLLGHGSTSHALTHRASLLLLAAPWLLLLSMGRRRSWIEHAAGWVLVGYMFDRLLEDFATFSPLAMLAAAGWIMVSLLRIPRVFKHRREVLMLTALGGAGLAAGLVRLPVDWPAYAVVSLVVVLALRLHTGDPTPSWIASRSAVILLVAGTTVGTLVLQGLVRHFVVLLSVAIVGWLTVGFGCWRLPRSGAARLASAASTVIAAALLTLLPTELYFRHVYDTSDANTLLCTHKRWRDRHAVYNSWGYRDEEYKPLNRFDDHLRVVLLGDSFTFAQGINRAEDMPSGRLQAELSERLRASRPVKVFNLSRGGATTQTELGMFRDVGAIVRPHVVVWQYLTNDADDMLDPRLRHQAHPVFDPWRPLLNASCGLEFLSWRAYEHFALPGKDPLAGSIGVYADDAKFSQHMNDIDALLGEIRAVGAKPVVWLFPLLDRPADGGPQGRALDRLERCFAERGVPTLSVRKYVKTGGPEHWVNRFDPHPNAALHRSLVPRLADLVLETLDENDRDSDR